MKRGHTSETFRDIITKFRTKFSKFTVSTDIIVGFPTETEDDFQKTVELLEETEPDIVNLSRYSRRPGTDAAEWDQVEVSEVKRRSKILSDLIERISLKNNQEWIGWNGDVLFDERTDRAIKGRNFAYKPIFVKEPVKIGEKHSVEIVDATTHSLVAKIAS